MNVNTRPPQWVLILSAMFAQSTICTAWSISNMLLKKSVFIRLLISLENLPEFAYQTVEMCDCEQIVFTVRLKWNLLETVWFFFALFSLFFEDCLLVLCAWDWFTVPPGGKMTVAVDRCRLNEGWWMLFYCRLTFIVLPSVSIYFRYKQTVFERSFWGIVLRRHTREWCVLFTLLLAIFHWKFWKMYTVFV